MLRTCKMCGAEFDAPSARTKYCSAGCADKSVWVKDHPGRSDDGMYHGTCPWCNKAFVVTHKRRFCSEQCAEEARKQAGRDRREQTYKAQEHLCLQCGKPIAFKDRGKAASFCSSECRERYRHPGEPKYLTDEMLQSKTSARAKNLEYIAKKPGSDKIVFRCKVCSGTFEHTSQVLRRDKFKGECPICKRRQIEEAAEQYARNVLSNKIIRALIMRKKRLQDEASQIRQCVICGKAFQRDYNEKCCSDECTAQARKDGRKEYRTRRRAKTKFKGNGKFGADSLSWRTIFEEEHGVCHLCGGKCNTKDYEIVEGAFIAGAQYPSIDHVVALANGGTHTRSNVRLAHFECNRIKGAH